MSHPEQLLPHDRVLRYEFKERMNHWVAAGSFIYLMLTGLAFWSPWLFWIASALGGAELSRMLHPWIGLVFFVAVCYMFALWSSQMNFDSVDAEILYGIVRKFKPRRIFEIGSGFSTLLVENAIRDNRGEDSSYACGHVAIDPFPADFLSKGGGGVAVLPLDAPLPLDTAWPPPLDPPFEC